MKQQQLEFPEPRTWGGRRNGSGRRKRKTGVAHTSRERVSRHDPRLVTYKLGRGLPYLRSVRTRNTITSCIRAAHKPHFRIVHYSIQSNHLHLIVEANNSTALAAGMKGFGCRLARSLNKLWKRRGQVFPQRYHDRVLRSLRQVRHALRYVLNNHLKHGEHPHALGAPTEPDPYSSGRYFDGWSRRSPDLEPGSPGAIVAAACWKIRVGWKRHHAPIALDESPMPGGHTRATARMAP